MFANKNCCSVSPKENWLDASSSLNVVLNFDQRIKNFLSQQKQTVFSDNSWIVFFPAIINSSIVQNIKGEFKNFKPVFLNSRFYVMAIESNDNFKIFELFRKGENGDLIVSEIWRFDTNGWNEIDSRFIWNRRKDLTGTHLKVAVKLNTSLFTQRDGVSYILMSFNCKQLFNEVNVYQSMAFNCYIFYVIGI